MAGGRANRDSQVSEVPFAGGRDSHDSQVPEVLVVPVVSSVSDVPLVVTKGETNDYIQDYWNMFEGDKL